MSEDELGLNTVSGLQRYAGQVAKLAVSTQDDDRFAQQLIDAVHTGDSAEVERVFAAAGVQANVSIATLNETAGTAIGDAAEMKAAAKASSRTTVTISIGIGPISISVTYTKDKTTK